MSVLVSGSPSCRFALRAEKQMAVENSPHLTSERELSLPDFKQLGGKEGELTTAHSTQQQQLA